MLDLIFYDQGLVVWKAENYGDVLPLFETPKSLFSLTVTDDEISVICTVDQLPDNPKGEIEHGWSYFKVAGQLDFSLTGILSSIAAPLAEAEISIFAISTFDTDYILIKTVDVENAKLALREKFNIKELS